MTVVDTHPTLDAARRYLATGWSPIPLEHATKWPPPNGVTGWRGRYTTVADLDRPDWTWTGNIALRLPPDVVGIDIDVYAGGGDSLAELKALHGELPPTTWSTSRIDGSGIALYRIPTGTVFATDPATGIDIIQWYHRYTVCAPSIHPDGRPYEWLDEQSMEVVDGPPEPWELPQLPWAWIEALSIDKSAGANAATPEAADSFITTHTTATRPAALTGVRKRLADVTPGGRHDALVATACWAMREAAAGLYSAEDAIAVLHGWWIGAVADDPRRREGGEFGGAILWAIGQAEADPERVTTIATAAFAKPVRTANHTDGIPVPPHVDPATGEILGEARNLPGEFWDARPNLAHIRQAAHARARSADAVLLFALARVCATIPPAIRLPPVVGGEASLNFLGAVIGTSGAGKSTAGAVARELVPINRRDVVADMPLGSGEGLAELYFEWVLEEQADGKDRRVKRKTRDGLYMYLDEGQALGEMGNRKGATLLPTLRAAWSGETIGNANATAETFRVVHPHTYRLALMVGFQVEHAKGLLDDAAGGTPQRFVFAAAVDATVPDEAPQWPGPLDIWLPSTSTVHHVDVDTAIVTEIRARNLAATRGQLVAEPLDSHRDLVRLKVAALLGYLDSRLAVNPDDWTLAGMIMRTSNAVRTWVAEAARTKAAAEEMAGHRRAATREVVVMGEVEQRALNAAARAVARKVHRAGGTAVGRRELTLAITSKHRQHASVDDATTEAERLLWIRPADGFDDGKWLPGEAAPT